MVSKVSCLLEIKVIMIVQSACELRISEIHKIIHFPQEVAIPESAKNTQFINMF